MYSFNFTALLTELDRIHISSTWYIYSAFFTGTGYEQEHAAEYNIMLTSPSKIINTRKS